MQRQDIAIKKKKQVSEKKPYTHMVVPTVRVNKIV